MTTDKKHLGPSQPVDEHLLDAVRTIARECDKHYRCEECPICRICMGMRPPLWVVPVTDRR